MSIAQVGDKGEADCSGPTLVQPLVDLVVAAGSSALFVCKICGRPRPTIEWTGPGLSVLEPSARVKLNYSDNNVVTLQVRAFVVYLKNQLQMVH